MRLFLSYADEDTPVALEIADKLNRPDVTLYSSQDDARHHGSLVAADESAIGQADAFLALLSPSFLADAACCRERDLALSREQHEPGEPFVQFLQVAETRGRQAGSLQDRPWLDLTSDAAKDQVLHDLVARFDAGVGDNGGGGHEPAPPRGGGSANGDKRPPFRNRENELDQVIDGLNNQYGGHFWVVIAAPQLGKSWFLQEVRNRLDIRQPGVWAIRQLDLRAVPAGMLTDVGAILAQMYGPAGQPRIADASSLAQAILLAGGRQLCLLDSAELLSAQTIGDLRAQLGAAHRLIQAAGRPSVWFSLIAATRRDQHWLSVSQQLRLHPLRLTRFSEDVILQALHEIREKNRWPGPADGASLQRDATLVYRLSEGLPGLLARYLDWIGANILQDLRQLDDPDRFRELAGPYVQEDLLSDACLAGSNGTPLAVEQREALILALRALSLYRLFTIRHLRYHAAQGPLRDAANDLRLSVEQLYSAVNRTDLLYRPQGDPWDTIDNPIRRLLCRYWYLSRAERCDAHADAGGLVRSILAGPEAGLLGKDQSTLLVECLWHEAEAMALTPPDEAEGRLMDLVPELVGLLRPSDTIGQDLLRQCAAEQMAKDYELEMAVEHIDGLLQRLIGVVAP